MKIRALSAALLLGGMLLTGCTRISPGEEGVMVHTMGSDRGVDGPLAQGWYFTGLFTSIYSFPTFTQNYNWTEGNSEQITFSDANGLNMVTDIGISYHVDQEKVVPLFLKYRRGIDEITNIYLHNMVRDALIEEASKHPVEYIYGEGRPTVINNVQLAVQKQVAPIGIVVEKIYWIGKLGLPANVEASINAKNAAVQQAQQRENEVKTAEAQAQIEVAKATGEANAILTKAKAQAESNDILSKSLTPELVEYQKALKWNGELPQVQAGTASMLFSAPVLK